MQKRIFSGVRPSGDLHIGNYLGAIRQWVRLQEDREVFFGIMDLHAITTPHDPAKLADQTLETAMAYLAAGLDPAKATLMVQSRVPAHAELAWILGTMTPLGELERMTQFKEKSRSKLGALLPAARQNVMAGLLNYPVLMAADILLYQADAVPVGEDQVQHVELARSIAERFNNRYGQTFTVPEVMLQHEAARIMALDDPTKKMSKSGESDRGYILPTDAPDAIREKIKTAVTDSGKEVTYNPDRKPAISNLLVIFSEFSGMPIRELERAYAGKSYVEFKADLAEAVISGLTPLQEKLAAFTKDPDGVRVILQKGSAKAAAIAEKTLNDVKQKIGFLKT
ncbi:MAG: tryptophan--tRNA ligase [Candidatus Sungbacteria bacterium RIFCSPLOWO2_01_FULL_59_16]|uniref:Tryptophan--tRNA ligase n=1 Tax=Candidatus Sungbacteria bacterium RIFCSPLOWO2_01_FULL_59_16 TaxID=1802280 RepID=A0A1G2LEI8_9BACT|nr:MAG: tryptophan--tRNA ligase [Candidatus Sungbacteria bacterium RIFCSPLOWO2_01_FULL_59_16]